MPKKGRGSSQHAAGMAGLLRPMARGAPSLCGLAVFIVFLCFSTRCSSFLLEKVQKRALNALKD